MNGLVLGVFSVGFSIEWFFVFFESQKIPASLITYHKKGYISIYIYIYNCKTRANKLWTNSQ